MSAELQKLAADLESIAQRSSNPRVGVVGHVLRSIAPILEGEGVYRVPFGIEIIDPETRSTRFVTTFPEALRALRGRAGLSCNHLAREVGIDPSYVSRLEREERDPPRLVIVRKLGQALNLTYEEAGTFHELAGYSRRAFENFRP